MRYDAWSKRLSDEEWIKNTRDIPHPQRIIDVKDKEKKEWLVLEGFLRWQQINPPDEEKYEKPRRDLWFIVKSYLVKKKDIEKIYDWAKKQNYSGRWMPESGEFYSLFLREFPWAPSFNPLSISYRRAWIKSARDIKIPGSILITDDEYLKESSGYDCSVDESIHIKLPARWLCNRMKLKPTNTDGEYSDSTGEVIFKDPSACEKGPGLLLASKKKLIAFLSEQGYDILWTVLGEKGVIGGNIGMGYWPGRLDISGAYRLDGESLVGSHSTKYLSPKS